MTDIRERFTVFDRLAPPDLWSQARQRQPGPWPPGPGRSKQLVTVVVALAIGVGATLLVFKAFRPTSVPGVSVQSGRVVLARSGPSGGSGIAADSGGLWLITARGELRLAQASLGATGFIPVTVGDQGDIAIGDGRVWVASTSSASIIEIDPSIPRVEARFPAPSGEIPIQVVAGHGRVWAVATSKSGGRLLVFNPTASRGPGRGAAYGVVADLALTSDPRVPFVYCDGSAWVDDGTSGLLQVTESGAPRWYPWGDAQAGGELACAAGGLWHAEGNEAVRLDVATGAVRVTARVNVPGRGLVGLEGSGNSLWAMTGTGSTSSSVYLPDPSEPSTVVRIDALDPGAGPSRAAKVGLTPAWIAASGDRAWVLDADGIQELRWRP